MKKALKLAAIIAGIILILALMFILASNTSVQQYSLYDSNCNKTTTSVDYIKVFGHDLFGVKDTLPVNRTYEYCKQYRQALKNKSEK
jgi:uncharacterized protein YpmB